MYKSCKTILEMDADIVDSDALGLTFVREFEEFGSRRVVELCPGGNSIIRELQKIFFQSLELEDLDLMLLGSSEAISVNHWKAHTVYHGYEETDDQIRWFWEVYSYRGIVFSTF
ncbi:hypothetical protein MKW94_005371 [Papaver nudicaule]|uniref:HECT-type E3 ubiquitin transferase n=1 Tax=Papaver nudicaule TaxID=74823 RepID=A0AA41S8Y1_PAPNU|nr:hypothetical protein [Papaver nudicaule]